MSSDQNFGQVLENLLDGDALLGTNNVGFFNKKNLANSIWVGERTKFKFQSLEDSLKQAVTDGKEVMNELKTLTLN